MKKQKKELRKKVINERDQLTEKDIAEKSRLIGENLFSLQAYHNAEAIMYFISFGTEVDTMPMVEETIRQGKIALAPKPRPQEREMIPSRILDCDNDFIPGAYNIPEPKEDALRPYNPDQIDLLIVPGVAFDLKGNRLGYGGGYYDRFFELLKRGTPLVALVFDLQVVPEVPVEEWDRRVDLIVTEKRVINPGKTN